MKSSNWKWSKTFKIYLFNISKQKFSNANNRKAFIINHFFNRLINYYYKCKILRFCRLNPFTILHSTYTSVENSDKSWNYTFNLFCASFFIRPFLIHICPDHHPLPRWNWYNLTMHTPKDVHYKYRRNSF